MKRFWRKACIFALFITGFFVLITLISAWEENHERYSSSKDLMPHVETWTRLTADEMSGALDITLSSDPDTNQFVSRWHYDEQEKTSRLAELLRKRGVAETRLSCPDKACEELSSTGEVLQFSTKDDAGEIFWLIDLKQKQVAATSRIPSPRFLRSP